MARRPGRPARLRPDTGQTWYSPRSLRREWQPRVGPLTIGNTVQNVGPAPAGRFRITFYLATGDATPGAGRQIGFRERGSLGAGASSAATTTPTLPADLPLGTYFLSAVVDNANGIIELDEANNGRVAVNPVAITLYRADLTITALSVSTVGAVVRGRAVGIANTVANRAAAASGAFRVGFFLSQDDVLDAGDRFLGSRSITSIDANAVSAATSSVTIPVMTPPGDYFVIAVVDVGARRLPEAESGLRTS